MRGKLIVIYGPNNLGKSKQLEMLAECLRDAGKEVVQLKYPIYESETGILINDILRHGVEASDEQLQELFARNRHDYEAELKAMLTEGKWVVAEDYVGTGLAWGLTKGVDRGFLDEVNKGLLEPDLAILLDAEGRFTCGIEKGHRHEAAGDEVWKKNREVHLGLAEEFGWRKVRADLSPERVHELVVYQVEQKFFPRSYHGDLGDEGGDLIEKGSQIDDGWL